VPTSLITGAAGFVGQYLVRELLQGGEHIVGGTMDGSPPDSGVLEPAERAAVEWVKLEVTSDDQLDAVLARQRPDRVYHLAAQSSVGGSFADVMGTWEVNATGTLRLIRAVAQNAPSARLLVVSSSEVYGMVREQEQPIPETRPLQPPNPYGASKAAAEIVSLQSALAGDLEVVIARSFNHTGPGQSTRFALPNWAAQLGRMARGEAEPVLRVGNLEARRDLLDVRDVVRAYRLLLESGESGGVYNVCSGEAHRLREVVEMMVEISGTGARIEVETERLRPVDIALLVGDPSRIRQLGWSPRIALRQTVADLLDAAPGEAK
jgi:GDP-4-dehydro-6-deoxy-D-mannose reductase